MVWRVGFIGDDHLPVQLVWRVGFIRDDHLPVQLVWRVGFIGDEITYDSYRMKSPTSA